MKRTSAFLTLAALLGAASVSNAQATTADEEATVKRLAGCFSVTYRFVEDGEHDTEITENIYEYVTLEEKEGALFFQHYGVQNGQAMKHWSEKWMKLDDGQWQQTVYSPKGATRYECAGHFKFNQWRCMAYNTPKPTRDTHRTDYSTIDRENTLQITPAGWVHAQTNVKKNDKNEAVSTEVGWNEYRRVADEQCAPALPRQMEVATPIR